MRQIVLDTETIKNGVEFADAQEKAKLAMTGLRNTISGPILKELAALAQSFA